MSNPLEKLLRGYSNEEPYSNPYDTNIAWDTKPTLNNTSSNGLDFLTSDSSLKNMVNSYKPQIEDDYLSSPRNQMNYYSKQLERMGIEPPKPTAFDKAKSIGGTIFQKALDSLNVLSTPINAITGTADSLIKRLDKTDKDIRNGTLSKFGLDSIGRGVTDLVGSVKDGLISGGATFLTPLNSKLRDKQVDVGTLLNNLRDYDKNGGTIKTYDKLGDMIEAVDKYSPIRYIANIFTDKYTATNVSKNINNLVSDIFLSGKFDIDGLGKAMRYVNKNDEMKKLSSLTDVTSKANEKMKKAITDVNLEDLKIAIKKAYDKTNFKDDELESLAKGLSNSKLNNSDMSEAYLKQISDRLGGVTNFDGIKMGNKDFISKENLDNIANSKSKKFLFNLASTYVNPFSTLYSIGGGKPIKWLSKDEGLMKEITSKFVGGKNQDMFKNMYKAYEDYLGGNTDSVNEIYKSYAQIKGEKGLKNISSYLKKHSVDEIKEVMDKAEKLNLNPERILKAMEQNNMDINEAVEIEYGKLNPKYLKEINQNANEAIKNLNKEVFNNKLASDRRNDDLMLEIQEKLRKKDIDNKYKAENLDTNNAGQVMFKGLGDKVVDNLDEASNKVIVNELPKQIDGQVPMFIDNTDKIGSKLDVDLRSNIGTKVNKETGQIEMTNLPRKRKVKDVVKQEIDNPLSDKVIDGQITMEDYIGSKETRAYLKKEIDKVKVKSASSQEELKKNFKKDIIFGKINKTINEDFVDRIDNIIKEPSKKENIKALKETTVEEINNYVEESSDILFNKIQGLIEERVKNAKAKYALEKSGSNTEKVIENINNIDKQVKSLLKETNKLKDNEVRLNVAKRLTDAINADRFVTEQFESKLNNIKEYMNAENPSNLIKWFESQGITPKNEKIIKAFEPFDNLSKACTIDKLENYNEKDMAKQISEMFRQMGISEKMNVDQISEYLSYIPHITNKDVIEDKKLVGVLNRLGINLDEPFNKFKMTREMQGTIDEINKVMKNEYNIDNFFENNLFRLLAERQLYSNNMVRKQSLTDLFKPFSIDVPDFKFENLDDYTYEDIVGVANSIGAEPILPIIKDGIGTTKKVVDRGLKDKDNANELIGEIVNGKKVYKMSEKDDIVYTDNQMKQFYLDGIRDKIRLIKQGKDEKFVLVDTKEDSQEKFIRKIKDKFFKESSNHEIEDNMIKNKNLSENELDEIKGKRNAKIRSEEQELMLQDEYTNKMIQNMNGGMTQEEAINDAEEFLKKLREDLNIDTGTPNVLTLEDTEEEILNKVLKREYQILKRDVFNQFQTSMNDLTYKGNSKILDIYDKALNLFKSYAVFSPSFHVNNAIGNTLNSIMDIGTKVFSPKINKQAGDLLNELYKVDFDFKKLSGQINGMNKSDFVEALVKEGVLSGFFDTDMSELNSFIKKESVKKTPLQKINPLNTNEFMPLKGSKKLGERIELHGKLTNLFAQLDSGIGLYEACNNVQKALFDYSDLTNFEENVIKKYIAPFYTYQRKNIVYQAEKLANNPKGMANIGKVYKHFERDAEEREKINRPEYTEGGIRVKEGTYLNIENPLTQMLSLTDGNNTYNMLNPLIKGVTEFATNTKSYTGSEISKTNNPLEKLGYVTKSVLPMINTSETIVKGLTGDEKDKDKLLRWLTANKIKGYDVKQAEKQTLYSYVNQLQNMYYDILQKNPELKAQADMKDLSEKDKKSYDSLLKKLLK